MTVRRIRRRNPSIIVRKGHADESDKLPKINYFCSRHRAAQSHTGPAPLCHFSLHPTVMILEAESAASRAARNPLLTPELNGLEKVGDLVTCFVGVIHGCVSRFFRRVPCIFPGIFGCVLG